MIYTGLGWNPTSSLIEDRVRVPRLNALKFLQWRCKNGGRGERTYAGQRVARRETLGALL
jgi:hypothetical protein